MNVERISLPLTLFALLALTGLTAGGIAAQGSVGRDAGGRRLLQIAAPQGPGGAESTVSRTPGIKGAILCLFGGQDALIPPDQVEQAEALIDSLRAEISIEAVSPPPRSLKQSSWDVKP